jgi:hypothetical protein
MIRNLMIRKMILPKLTWILFVAARLCAADPRNGVGRVVSADSALDPARVSSLPLKARACMLYGKLRRARLSTEGLT